MYNITEGFWLITMRRPSPSILRKGEGGEREREGEEREREVGVSRIIE